MLKEFKELGLLGSLAALALSLSIIFVLLQAANAVFSLGRVPSASPLERQYDAYETYRDEKERATNRLASFGSNEKTYPQEASDRQIANSQKSFSYFEDRYADVTAQEGMWRAAEYLVFLTFAQAVFFILSLIWLKRTFDATVRTAVAAENAESANMYPEIAVTARKFKYVGEEDAPSTQFPRVSVSIDVKVKNFGKTPAKNVSLTLLSQQIISDVDDISSSYSTPTIKENLFVPQDGSIHVDSVLISDRYPIRNIEHFKESPICVLNLVVSFDDSFYRRKEIEIETKVFLIVTLSQQFFPNAGQGKPKVISRGYVDFEGNRTGPVRHESRITREEKSD